MAKAPLEILQLSWQKQAAYLKGLSRRDLELFWFEMQEEREGFDRLYLAVFSILRDLYEAECKKGATTNAQNRGRSRDPVQELIQGVCVDAKNPR